MSLGENDPKLSEAVRAVMEKAAGGESLSVEDRAVLLAGVGRSGEAGVSEVGGAEDLKLSGEVGPARWPYGRRIADYAETYQTDLRNVKRWLERGRMVAPEDLPPLDDPAKMPAWWARRMKHRVPEKLLVLAKAAADAAPPVVPNCNVANGKPVSGESGGAGEHGIGSPLQRLREAEREAGAAYRREQNPGKDAAGVDIPVAPGLVEIRRRAWESLVETLRKEEAAEEARLKSRGGLLTKTEVVAELRPVHGEIKQKIQNFLRDVRADLRGLTEAEQDVVYAARVNAFFEFLQGNEFAAGLA